MPDAKLIHFIEIVQARHLEQHIAACSEGIGLNIDI